LKTQAIEKSEASGTQSAMSRYLFVGKFAEGRLSAPNPLVENVGPAALGTMVARLVERFNAAVILESSLRVSNSGLEQYQADVTEPISAV
jgi:hypothetical protein